MAEIVATAEQAQVIRGSTFPIVLRDAAGLIIGEIVAPICNYFSREDIEKVKQRAGKPGKRYTTAEVLAYLRSLAPE